MFLIYSFVAFIGGIAIAAQSAINTQLAKSLNGEPIIATLISFAVGTVLLFFIAVVKTDLWHNLTALPQIAWWKFLGGALGAGMVFITVVLAPKLGITAMVFFIMIGQLLTATSIDHFGLIGMPVREITTAKFIGLIIIGCGLTFYFFGEALIRLIRT